MHGPMNIKSILLLFVHNPHLCSMQCDEIFVCEGFCTGGSALPAGGALWSMCIVVDTGVDTVRCFW